jgi:hypothetical protein
MPELLEMTPGQLEWLAGEGKEVHRVIGKDPAAIRRYKRIIDGLE